MRSSNGPETLRLIIGGAARRAAARQRRIAEMAATARVHRRDHLNPRRKGDVRIGPGNADRPGFERLAKESSTGRWNSGNSSRNRTPRCARLISPGRTCRPPPTSAGIDAQWWGALNGRRRRIGRLQARPRPRRPSTLRALRTAERGKNARKTGGEQRFARPRRAAHQQIVAACRGDLERALGDLLALDLAKVGAALGRFGLDRRGPRPARCP